MQLKCLINYFIFVGLWNYVFLFSNLSLFVFLPFAYLFTESEGFFGHRKGLMARIHETFIVLILLAIVVLGITCVISALIDENNSSIQTILSKYIRNRFLSYIIIVKCFFRSLDVLPAIFIFMYIIFWGTNAFR